MFGDSGIQPMALIVYFFTLSILNGFAPPENKVIMVKNAIKDAIKNAIMDAIMSQSEKDKSYLFGVNVNLEIGGDLD